jgi:hypothetical protein
MIRDRWAERVAFVVVDVVKKMESLLMLVPVEGVFLV